MDHDIIVIGASAGGVAALRSLVSRLPADLDAAIFIVIHLSPNRPSYLADILARCGPLPAHSPADGEEIRPGHIYVATPDRHLLLENGRVRVSCGAKVNRMRPAVDPLFQTAALAYRDRVVGVVLTGVLDDGTAGLAAIKAMGGWPWCRILKRPSSPTCRKARCRQLRSIIACPSPKSPAC